MFQYVIVGDSVVNGTIYQKYYRSNDSIFDLNQATLVALFREDLATRRSYIQLPTTNLPNGMYFVQYIADRQVRAVARLAVQH